MTESIYKQAIDLQSEADILDKACDALLRLGVAICDYKADNQKISFIASRIANMEIYMELLKEIAGSENVEIEKALCLKKFEFELKRKQFLRKDVDNKV